jgi:hypothetical protein
VRTRASTPDGSADKNSGKRNCGRRFEANGNDVLGLLGMLLERLAILAGAATEGTGVSTVLSREHGDGKIQGRHRDGLAVVYARQSSRQQVLDHGEWTRLQYGLAVG